MSTRIRQSPVHTFPNTDEQLLRSKLPAKQIWLQPKVVDAHQDLKHRQLRQKSRQQAGTSPLPQLNQGDVVCVQKGKVWEPAVIRGSHIQLCSYLVQSQHGHLRRNRRHLGKTNELSPLFVPPVGAAPSRPVAPPDDTQATQMTHDRVTRSGRVVKAPLRYQ